MVGWPRRSSRQRRSPRRSAAQNAGAGWLTVMAIAAITILNRRPLDYNEKSLGSGPVRGRPDPRREGGALG